MKKSIFLALSAIVFIHITSCDKLVPGAPEPGDTIAEPTDGLTPAQMAQFIAGDELFAKVFTPAEGLGPIFIQNSCEGCHVGDGKGHPFNTETRFGKLTPTGFDFMLDKGGPQLQFRSLQNYIAETLPPGYTHTSDRIAPIVIGMGHLAGVSDADILALADPNDLDGDGISGRVNYVEAKDYFNPQPFHIQDPTQSGFYIGRFGKKAKEITLLDQIVFALKQDMGLTSDFDTEDLYNWQIANGAVDNVPDPEVGSDVVNKLLFYMRTLKTPTRRNENDADVLAGEQVFDQIGCVKCHVSTMKTGYSEIEALNNKTFHPYTDLLLHDMGSLLDDGVPEGDATGSEWRTPPLWGLGLAEDSQGGTGYYLHDGRATSLEQAIGFHATGEASNIANNYYALTQAEKDNLIAFLKSL
ncbi:MAG: thiol oxidoreductase [Flavobacteriales bacterium]|nr:MAG: thiol oxidoreductase [Flavobacteriales bacterium]